MNYLPRVLAFAFVQSVASVLVQRGVFFFTDDRLHYSDTQNLWLAVGMGLMYIVGALPSHRLAQRLGERRAMLLLILAQAACMGALNVSQTAWNLATCMMLFSVINGMLWPIAESYASAGMTPRQVSRAIGLYNIAWASASPVAVWSSGPIIRWLGPWLFGSSAIMAVIGGAIVLMLPARPAHHPANHPDRPDAQRLTYYRALTNSCRWSMVHSYCLLSVLAPLMPGLFKNDLKVDNVALATVLSSGIEVSRLIVFAVLQRTEGWHGRRTLALAAIPLLPLGFVLTIWCPNLGVVIAGGLIFGVGAGLAYFGALYYAMVVSNAAVDAGGAHEAVIGSGFTVGPLAALGGQYLGKAWGYLTLGTITGVAPAMLVFTGGALWTIKRARKPTVKMTNDEIRMTNQ